MLTLIRRAVVVYFFIGFLTVVHWDVVWLKGQPISCSEMWSRCQATIVFGPYIALTWPEYWFSMVRLGRWAWWSR